MATSLTLEVPTLSKRRVWVKTKPPGNRRFSSLFSFARVSFGTYVLPHSGVNKDSADRNPTLSFATIVLLKWFGYVKMGI